ncbi:hypothetical protein OSTOST_14051, partial [Ostertagia ostertagi]
RFFQHSVSKNPFPPVAHKTHGVAGATPKQQKVDLSTRKQDGTVQRRSAASVLHPSGLMSSSSATATVSMTTSATDRPRRATAGQKSQSATEQKKRR